MEIPKKTIAILLLVIIVFTVVSTLSMLNIVYSSNPGQQSRQAVTSGEVTLIVQQPIGLEQESTAQVGLNIK